MKSVDRIRSQLIEIGSSASHLPMPMPRRQALEPVQGVTEHYLGPALALAHSYAIKEAHSAAFVTDVKENHPALRQHLESAFGDWGNVNFTYLQYRHLATKSPIFTATPALSAMLTDTKVKRDVPVKFCTGPFKTCYIEFEPAEVRAAAAVETGSAGIVEGCYVSETLLDRLPEMTRMEREGLELDPNAPVRILELGFTVSPLNVQSTRPPVLAGNASSIVFYIQDENESLMDVVDRYVQFHTQGVNALAEHDTGAETDAKFAQELKDNIGRLIKILFYLHVERNAKKVEKPASDLEKRLESLGPKKVQKQARQLNRVYDRIVVGPSQYTPLAERVLEGSGTGKQKAPHYSSSYFAVRWNGTGQARIPVLTKIKESIKNKHLMTDRPVRDYEIAGPSMG